MNQALPMVYLVRHSDAAWTLTGEHTGRTDLPLAEQGERQARELGASLTGPRIDRIAQVEVNGMLPQSMRPTKNDCANPALALSSGRCASLPDGCESTVGTAFSALARPLRRGPQPQQDEEKP